MRISINVNEKFNTKKQRGIEGMEYSGLLGFSFQDPVQSGQGSPGTF